MFAIFNLGMPELLILATMGFGACAAAVVLVLVLGRKRPPDFLEGEEEERPRRTR